MSEAKHQNLGQSLKFCRLVLERDHLPGWWGFFCCCCCLFVCFHFFFSRCLLNMKFFWKGSHRQSSPNGLKRASSTEEGPTSYTWEPFLQSVLADRTPREFQSWIVVISEHLRWFKGQQEHGKSFVTWRSQPTSLVWDRHQVSCRGLCMCQPLFYKHWNQI